MIVTIGCHAGDADDAHELVKWIYQLGGTPHHLMLVLDAGISFVKAMEIRDSALKAFRSVKIVTTEVSISGWPLGPNALFRTAMQNASHPFLWLEPDAIPLTPDWATRIEREYYEAGRPIMGCFYEGETDTGKHLFVSGVAVYPKNAAEFLNVGDTAWDQSNHEAMIANGQHTHLIKHFFGTHKVPPAFTHKRTARTRPHEFDVEPLRSSGVAIFHRNKDGSLRRLLQKQMFGTIHRKPIKVVFPVHNGDIMMAMEHAKWMQRIAVPKWRHEAIVAFDKSSAVVPINHFEQMLRNCFERVSSFVYERPPFPVYPQAANWAFQSVAHHMATQDHSWLWFEADAVVLKHSWLSELQAEYEACCRDFMGVVVPHMFHLNGVAIYPPDTPTKMKGAFQTLDSAFDMTGNISHLAHDASDLMFHVWTLVGRMAHPVGGGELPVNITAAELRAWLPKSAVFTHRCKDLSILRLLMSGEYRH